MFVGASVQVQHSMKACARVLAQSPDNWFPRVVERVGQSTENRLAAVGFAIAGLSLRKKVEVTVGEAVNIGDWVRIPLSWTSTFPAGLFPTLDGKLELFPLDPASTRLTISGSYTPPFEGLGQKVDEMVMHEAAQATVKDLAQAIAEEIDRTLVGG